MPGLIRTPAAEDDLLEIAYFIAVEQGRPLTAEQIIDDIVAKCGEYAASPLIGTAVPALGEGYRSFHSSDG
jgi:plasmid stabilization system protein ParE